MCSLGIVLYGTLSVNMHFHLFVFSWEMNLIVTSLCEKSPVILNKYDHGHWEWLIVNKEAEDLGREVSAMSVSECCLLHSSVRVLGQDAVYCLCLSVLSHSDIFVEPPNLWCSIVGFSYLCDCDTLCFFKNCDSNLILFQ